MKLGYIDYLNCFPFYYTMFEKKPLEGIEVVPAHPTDLNRMMGTGELEMSPISSAAYADLQDRIVLLPDFCLSSIGYVRSVVLHSKIPIEELGGRRLGLSCASQTSVVLLKILLEKYYQMQPHYLPTSPHPVLEDIDAALIIGNEAMIQPKEPVPYIYDLGDLWMRKTGFPVVFAVFAIREEVIKPHAGRIKGVVRSYRESLDCLRSERGALIAKAHARYPQITYDIDTYYSLLKFEFTEQLKNALSFYLLLAGEMGLLKKVDSLKFITFDHTVYD